MYPSLPGGSVVLGLAGALGPPPRHGSHLKHGSPHALQEVEDDAIAVVQEVNLRCACVIRHHVLRQVTSLLLQASLAGPAPGPGPGPADPAPLPPTPPAQQDPPPAAEAGSSGGKGSGKQQLGGMYHDVYEGLQV